MAICDLCDKTGQQVGTCNWTREPHCRLCCNDRCDPDWRAIQEEEPPPIKRKPSTRQAVEDAINRSKTDAPWDEMGPPPPGFETEGF